VRRGAVLLMAATCALAAGPAAAQDAHYWNKQYGNHAYLLGGAVIGSDEDISAVYYNPSLLALADGRSLEIAGNAYHASQVRLDNALGEGADLTTTAVGLAPSLMAGEIPLGERMDRRLAYSVLYRHDFNVVMELRGPVSLPGILGDARARLGYEENVNEIWSGLSYAQRMGAGWSLGATVFASYRTHRSRRGFLTASETVGQYGVAVRRDDFDYTQFGLLAKVGVAGRYGPWRVGAVLTTPTVGLGGSGSKSYDRLVAIEDQDTGRLLEYMVAATQDGIATDYRTPLSLGVGGSYRWERAELHVSAEYFAGQEQWAILDADPVIDDESGGVIDMDLRASSRALANWGVGLEYDVSRVVTAFASYHTDLSSVENVDPGGALAVWDIHHLAGGASATFGNKRVSLGVVYATGSEPLGGTLDLVPGDGEDADGSSLTDGLEASYRSVMVLLGFNVDY
jgi:hypothetical protein